MTDSRAEWTRPSSKVASGPSRDIMAQALQHSAEVRRDFQMRVIEATAHLHPEACQPEELDSALMQVSMVMFPSHSERRSKPWQSDDVQLTLKQLWSERSALGQAQRQLRHAAPVGGFFAVWRRWASFHKVRKQLRRASADKRRQHWDEQLQEAETALGQGDARAFYSVVKRMAPRLDRGRVQLRSPAGDILTADEEVEALYSHWKQVFDLRSLPEQEWVLCADMEVGLEEVRAVLCAMAARKATMPGTAPGAAWRYGGPRLAELVHGMIKRHWLAGSLRHDSFLTKSWLHFLEKPGRTLRSPSDLRPIALQPGASKIFSALIKARLQPYLRQVALCYPQFAYVEGRGTTEAIGRIAQHCSRVRSAVQGQKQDLRSKHAGIQRASCTGGCQLSIDLSRAFDSVPRLALLRALEWAGVPADLCALVLSWHEASVYVLGARGDPRHQRCIAVTRGVKQGCLIAPALWTIFSCFVWSHFDQIAGLSWNSEHTTGYADDFHFRWELGSYKQCRQVGLDMDMIFAVLKTCGLQINPEKSHFLVEVRGSDAEKWLRKHKVRNKAGDGWSFRFNLFTKEEVPIVKKFRYLGVIMSYHAFEDETLCYRLELAQAHRNRLAKVLQGRGGLGLAQRRRIWQVCVQTSQTYGLVAVGLTAAGLRKLHIQTLKHIRAFAKSPRHISREADKDLLQRLGLDNPHDTLLKQLDCMLARHRDGHRLPSYGLEALLEWLEKLRRDLGSLGQGIRLTSASQSATGQAQSAAAIASATLVPLPDDTPMYACQVCGQHFPTLHQVKTHEGRFHKQFAPQRDLTNKASYSLDGLPTCRFCRQAFVRWTSLQRHIRLNRCPGLRVTSSTGQTCDRETHSDASAPLTRPGPDTESKAAVWTLDRPLAQSALHPVLHWSSVLELAPSRRWEDIVKLPGVVDYLRRHCGLCGQWIAKTNGVRKHLRESHRSEWERHAERIEHWTRSWSKVITRPCPVCSANVVDIRQHGGSCVVMQQAALVQLCLSGCKADERPLQSDAGSWGGCDGGRGDGARASEKAQAGGARAEAEAKGQRERQGQRPGQKGRGGGLLRFFGPSAGGQAIRAAGAPAGRGIESAGVRHLLPVGAADVSSPRHGDPIALQSCLGVEGEAGALSQRPHTESEAGDFGVPGEGAHSAGGHDRQHTRGQEAGRGHGPVGWGSLGLSDLGPQAATECPGHIAEAGSCGGLSSSDINHAAVHPGGGTHKVSSTEAPDGGALGHASPIPPRCLPERQRCTTCSLHGLSWACSVSLGAGCADRAFAGGRNRRRSSSSSAAFDCWLTRLAVRRDFGECW